MSNIEDIPMYVALAGIALVILAALVLVGKVVFVLLSVGTVVHTALALLVIGVTLFILAVIAEKVIS